MYIGSQLATNQEKEKLRDAYLLIDKDGDGKLSSEDLVEAYRKYFGTDFEAVSEVVEIMGRLDMDRSGYIDYSEFVLATMNKKTLLTAERLKIAFAMFDLV